MSAIRSIQLVKELCIDFYMRGNDDRDADPNNRVWQTARDAAEQMETLELNWGTANPWAIAAACTYMVSQLEVRLKTFEEVSRMSGVLASSIRNT